MTSSIDSAESSNHLDHQDENFDPSTIEVLPENINNESIETEPKDEELQTEIDTNHQTSSPSNSINMITAENASNEAAAGDLSSDAPRSSVARILVKSGQIFRVQIDNQVREVHGKCFI